MPTSTTPVDPYRQQNLAEIEEIRRMNDGVTQDSTKKDVAMDASFIKTFVLTPEIVNNLSLNNIAPANLNLATVNTTDFTAVADSNIPAGLGLAISGSIIKLTGTATSVGRVSFTITVSKPGYQSKTFSVGGIITQSADSLLTAVTTVSTGPAIIGRPAKKTFQADLTGGTSATVVIEGSNTGTGWISLGTISLTTAEPAQGFYYESPIAQVRARVTAISGNGATVSCAMGS